MGTLSSEEHAERLAYIQALIEYTRDDARQVYIRVTAALAIAALFVTQIPFKNVQALNDSWTGVLFAGVVCLVLAALLFFVYVGDTHHTRRKIAKYLLDVELVTPIPEQGKPWEELDNPADHILTRLWRSRRWWAFAVANGLFALGGILFSIVVAKMILRSSNKMSRGMGATMAARIRALASPRASFAR